MGTPSETRNSKPETSFYDVAIIGGGMAGASLALALKDLPLSVALVEAVPFESGAQPAFDARAIALAAGSQRILQTMGVWPAMTARGVTAIEHIHVSERGGFGSARLQATEENVTALGYVVEGRVIGAALTAALAQCPRVELLCPSELTAAQVTDEAVEMQLLHGGAARSLRARLLVAADGGHSTVRDQLGARTWDLGYGQTAVIATVATDRPHGNTAYERFTDTGPLALLPCDPPADAEPGLSGRRWSLVWTVRDGEVDEMLALDDAAFMHRLQQRFGYRAGRFLRVSQRHAYPLALRFVRVAAGERVAYIGNAAHAIHPVAGQGFNLGLRDVAALAQVIAGAVGRGADIGSLAVLRDYAAWRRPDYLRTAAFTDGLVRTYSNNLPPLKLARNLGLLALDALPPLKHLLARQSMGLVGHLPRLACGLPVSSFGFRVSKTTDNGES
jgi:2-octaprenyl-6-methoxyphenol hydroxylase